MDDGRRERMEMLKKRMDNKDANKNLTKNGYLKKKLILLFLTVSLFEWGLSKQLATTDNFFLVLKENQIPGGTIINP